MFYVELNPGEDADEEDVISQSIKEIHQVATLIKENLKKKKPERFHKISEHSKSLKDSRKSKIVLKSRWMVANALQ